jgi:hypothetical protein
LTGYGAVPSADLEDEHELLSAWGIEATESDGCVVRANRSQVATAIILSLRWTLLLALVEPCRHVPFLIGVRAMPRYPRIKSRDSFNRTLPARHASRTLGAVEMVAELLADRRDALYQFPQSAVRFSLLNLS